MESDLDVVHRDWPKDRRPQTFVDPQLLKIPRRIRPANIAATALGQAGRKTLQTVPASSMWNILYGQWEYAATATAGTRNVEPQVRDSDGNIRVRMMRKQPTAGTTSSWEFGTIFSSRTLVNWTIALDGSQEPLIPLLEGFALTIDDTSDVDNADTVLERYTIGEYSLPRGLARNEIPMGLESGFLWDLAEPRRVA